MPATTRRRRSRNREHRESRTDFYFSGSYSPVPMSSACIFLYGNTLPAMSAMPFCYSQSCDFAQSMRCAWVLEVILVNLSERRVFKVLVAMNGSFFKASRAPFTLLRCFTKTEAKTSIFVRVFTLIRTKTEVFENALDQCEHAKKVVFENAATTTRQLQRYEVFPPFLYR